MGPQDLRFLLLRSAFLGLWSHGPPWSLGGTGAPCTCELKKATAKCFSALADGCKPVD